MAAQRQKSAVRDTKVCIKYPGTLAIVPWMSMMAGTLAT